MPRLTEVSKRVLPFLSWIGELNAGTLRADLLAGVTVALVLIPQSMAYAQLAGLPAHFGLYAAFLPPMIASLFGSSRQLATGPVAVVSLMTAAALEPLAVAGSEEYIAFAILLALMVGIFQFLLGVLRLGLIVNFLSHPVVNGFTCAAALIIATSQLPKIFGVQVDKAEHHYQTVIRVVMAAIDYTHWPTLGMAVLAFGTMIILKRVNPKIPNVLVAVVLTTLLSALLGFQRNDEAALEQIESPIVTETMAQFNRTVAELEQLQLLRAKAVASISAMPLPAGREGEPICARCHAPRVIESFSNEGTGTPPQPSADALPLHFQAGVVDECMQQVTEEIADLRATLRGFHLRRMVVNDDQSVFFLDGQTPEGSTIENARWRLKVGTNSMDVERIPLMGGGAVVGSIPKGLPSFRVPVARDNLPLVLRLIPAAIIISILGFMEAISIAKAMASKTRQKLDPDQELIGQGLANIVGCFGRSYACSGSFSRSAVNLQAGARTGMSSVFSSAVVVILLLFFTPLLYHLPQAVLAAIIMMAVVGLLNVSGFVHAWRVQKLDGITGIITFSATLILAPHLEWGILIGVAISLGGYLFRTMRPGLASLSPHPDGSLRNARRHGLTRCRHLAVLRFDGPLNFASVNYLEDKILGELADMPELHHVLVDGHGTSEIDASGEEMLRHLIRQLRASGYGVSFVGLNDNVIDAMKRAHLYEIIGEDRFFPTQAQAVAAVYPAAHAGSSELDCPFRTVMPRVTEVSLHADGALRDAQRHNLRVCEHIVILRFDDPLDYANTSFLEEEILDLISDRPEPRHVLFVAQGITEIDSHGAEKLVQIVERIRAQDHEITFSSFNDAVLDYLQRAGVVERIGREHIYPTQALAIMGIYARAHSESAEQDCPLTPLLPRLIDLSLHPDGSLRDAKRHRLRLCRHIAAVRFDGPLNFGAIAHLKSELVRRLKDRREVNHVLIAAHSIIEIDKRAAQRLGLLVSSLRERGFEVSFSGFQDHILDVLHQVGVYDTIRAERIFPTQAAAVASIHAETHAGSSETECPLQMVVYATEGTGNEPAS